MTVVDDLPAAPGPDTPTVVPGIGKTELVILGCVLYDPGLYAQYTNAQATNSQLTLGQWAANFDMNAYMSTPDDHVPHRGHGGMTQAEMQSILDAVANNPALANATILNVGVRDAGGNMATIASGDSLIVAYQGTAGAPEWMDDGIGGKAGVTDTPDQMAALRYFNQMMGQYGSQYGTVLTTGHSKGGNLAAYVGMMSGGAVNQVVSIDGQGFNAAAQMKYHDQIAAMDGKILSYSCTLDFVNILFGSVASSTVYTEGPDINPYDDFPFEESHSPYSMLYVDENGNVQLRPEAEQNPAMTAAVNLVSYLMKYMSAEDFGVICDLAMGLVNKSLSVDNIVSGKIGVGSLFDILADGDWEQLNPDYRETFKHLVQLLGTFYQGGGLSPQDLKAIEDLLAGLGVSLPVAAAGETVVTQFLGSTEPLPYWPEVRDFSDAAKEQLLALVDKVTPHGLGWIWDFFGDGNLLQAQNNGLLNLDFSMDDAARQTYYEETIDLNDMTRQQIEDIFADVIGKDLSWSVDYGGYTSTLYLAKTTLTTLDEQLQG